MTATFADVSTRPGMSALIFRTPWERAAIVFTKADWRAFGMTFPFCAPGTSVRLITRSGSTEATSALSVALADFTIASASARFLFGMNISAEHSRGMALRLFPPSIEESRAPSSARCMSVRFRILIALPRPLSISSPEWPPFKPVTVNRQATEFAGAASGFTLQLPIVSLPPEQPT